MIIWNPWHGCHKLGHCVIKDDVNRNGWYKRKDGKPVEEFFYHTFEAAISHFLLFKDDDSDLYIRIEIIDLFSERTVSIQEF